METVLKKSGRKTRWCRAEEECSLGEGVIKGKMILLLGMPSLKPGWNLLVIGGCEWKVELKFLAELSAKDVNEGVCLCEHDLKEQQ